MLLTVMHVVLVKLESNIESVLTARRSCNVTAAVLGFGGPLYLHESDNFSLLSSPSTFLFLSTETCNLPNL